MTDSASNTAPAPDQFGTDPVQPAAGPAGYDQTGYDQAGYDQAGYDQAGYDRAGFDRAGFDQLDRDPGGRHRPGPGNRGRDR